MKYRSEIDGLRALAVVPVILFHAGFELFSGGFLGVDVFFVISGFLITTILYEQKITGTFSILKFYDRRLRRILPPLVLTVFLTIAIAATFTPSDIKNVGQSIVATFTFLSNYFFYLETDYFNPFNQASPLLHTWSLSVEEQFYLFAPILIYLTAKLRLFKYLIVLGLLATSFYFAVTLTNDNPNLSFYSLHTRAWELLIGTILAFICKDFSRLRPNQLVSETVSLLSIAALTISFVTVNKSYSHPSFMTTIPALSTAALIYFTPYAVITKYFLSGKLLVGIGLISYSLYLFHNPIFSAIKYHFQDHLLLMKISSIPLIALLSYLSYKFVEAPSRNPSILTNRVFHTALSLTVVVLISLGYLAHSQNGFLSYFKRNFAGTESIIVDVDKEKVLIDYIRDRYYPSDGEFDCDDIDCQKILVIGDSFSEDAYFALQVLESQSYSVRRIKYDDECMGGYSVNREIQSCNNVSVSTSLIGEANIIVISAKWQESTYRDGFNFAEIVDGNSNAAVILVGSVMFEDLSSFAFRLGGVGNNSAEISKLAYANQRFDRLRISNKLRELVNANSRIFWIEKSNFFCDQKDQTCNLYDKDFKPVIWDNAHLTSRAYLSYGEFLIDSIHQLLMINE